MRRSVRVVLGGAVLVGVIGSVVVARTLRHGFSARDKPTAMEELIARTARRLAVPADLKHRKNPVALTDAVLAEARAHFADHCANCHGNDGRGRTTIGSSLYPKVPDMTLPGTQEQSDGELFATIENGVRLTGMPAWGDGTAESAYGSWTLVHFIRHMPKLTPEDLADMERLNPKSLAELEAMRDEESFLSGDDATSPPPARSPSAPSHAH